MSTYKNPSIINTLKSRIQLNVDCLYCKQLTKRLFGIHIENADLKHFSNNNESVYVQHSS